MIVQTDAVQTWQEANQRRLTGALARVKAALHRHVPGTRGRIDTDRDGAAWQEMSPPDALSRVCTTFALSRFERDILVLCAGVELDSSVGPLCAAAQGGDPQRSYPTFSLALAALPDAHWSALTPDAPLRYWRLIEISAGSSLTMSPLRIDERTLHFLAGVQHLDDRLTDLVEPVVASEDLLVPSQHRLVSHVTRVWQQPASQGGLPLIQLCGDDAAGKQAVAAAACASLGLSLSRMSASCLPTSPHELGALMRLWQREAALSGCALLLDCDDLDGSDAPRVAAVDRLVGQIRAAVFVSSRERRGGDGPPLVTFDVERPTAGEQAAVWRRSLGEAGNGNGAVDALVAQFSLSVPAIRAACTRVLGAADDADLGARLWDACRAQSRPRLESLARRIEPVATWNDIVLPEAQLRTLREAAAHVRQRARVYDQWGFAARSARGLGISLLAAGPSGTGKTMAAEVLASDLHLDLYHIDLSQVVSKYIGETEKNLARLFDAAEGGGAILLFDEADALFGKRSEVKDSHDRYANIEISYLLQRMEAYRGLAILTTNMKDAIDTAFLRRIRFVVQFPFPDTAQRAEIWRRVFPPATPTEGLDIERLARLNLAGGSIRNVAMSAAFLAAEAGEPVRMKHLAGAARGEYAKLEKPLSEAEIGAWT